MKRMCCNYATVCGNHATGTRGLSTLNLKNMFDIFFSVERVLRCYNGFKFLISLKNVLFQSCYNLFHAATMLDFPARRNLFDLLKKLVFQNKNSMVGIWQKRNLEV